MSASESLARIEAAIAALENGGVQSYSIGSRSVTKLNLAELYTERRQLKTEAYRESGSGGISLGKMTRARR